MCRIFAGIIKEGDIAPILRIGLKRLEYGGYDSAGIATIYEGKIHVKKDKGKIDEIHQKLNLDELKGNIGIAHTRWATHGAPSKINAHPHLDCNGNIAIVHNGIIENFLELKQELEQLNHKFVSKTDTEVIAHLIEEYYKVFKNFKEAFIEAIKRLQGSYAISVISTYEPDKIFLAKNGAPLLLGKGKDFNFASSDAIAFIDKTKECIPLEDNEIAIISLEGYEIYKLGSGTKVNRKPIFLNWNLEQASKEGYDHYMLKEIMEQETSMRWSLNAQKIYLELISDYMDKADKVF
jgi:Glucosamine 6-phosphate synthetase, contains amidotransferase and phosphosugar isomerase domains